MRTNHGFLLVPAFALLVLCHEPAQAQTCSFSGPCGDVDHSGTVTSGDALRVLRKAVGQALTLTCVCDEGSCSGDLATCNAALSTCDTSLSSCQDELAACNAAGHFPATGQTTSYGTGDDGDVRAGTALAFTDNADGTISDETTVFFC